MKLFKTLISKHTELYLFAFLVIFFFVIYTVVLPHIPYYHEQHHLFLFSKAYFNNTINSDGLLGYITIFIIQFFYYPLSGSLLLALMLASVYGLIAYTARKITGHTDILFLGLMPVLYLFTRTLSVDYKLTEIVASLIVLSVIVLPVAIFKGRYLKYAITLAACLALLSFIPWKIIAAAILIISLSTFSAFLLRVFNKKQSLIVASLAIIAYLGFGNNFFKTKFLEGEKYMILAKKYVNEKKWDEAISLTEDYMSSGRKNILMFYYRNIALFHKGRLGDDMLNVPQSIGDVALCFTWRSNSRDTEYGYDAYYELEHWNAAKRWAFESMIVWGETAPCLVTLAACNIKAGKYPAAQKFLNLLKQSLFYRKTAKELEKEIATASREIETMTAHREDENKADSKIYFSGKDELLWELELLCQKNPQNKMAFEYFMSALLLNNYVLDFAQNIHRMKAFDYKKMPRIFDEALCICKMMEKEEFAKLGIEVSPETEARFQRYSELFRQQNRTVLKREFENSYWYYIHFVSTYGNQLRQQQRYGGLEIPQGGLEH